MLHGKIQRILVAEVTGIKDDHGEQMTFSLQDVQLDINIFQLQLESPREMDLDHGKDEKASPGRLWPLPSTTFEGLWESYVLPTHYF